MVSRHSIPALVLTLILALGLSPYVSNPVRAQAESQSGAAGIVIEGPVQAVNVNVITIADLDIVLDSSDPLLTTLHVGDVIRVDGDVVDSAGVLTIQATTVVITNANIVSPVVTLTGPVQAINVNIVTIFNLAIQFNPTDPILLALQVGDVIQVSGNLTGFNGSLVIVPVQVEIIVKTQPEATPDPANGVLIRGFVVTYGGRNFDGSNTTFTYVVSGAGTPPDLSHFDLEIPVCVPPLQVVGYDPTQAVSFGVDPTTGVNGIKWDLSLGTTETRTYTLTFAGNVPEGTVVVAVKGGNGFESTTLPGAGCGSTAVDVEKLVSVDGGITWQDADSAPGPDVSLGTTVMFRFVVKNIGQTELTNLALADSVYAVSSCPIPAALVADAFFECTVGPFDAEAGQHTNLATVTALAGSQQVQDTDPANYFGGDRPAVGIEKSVSIDHTTWADADQAPGLAAGTDDEVYFRLVVTNTGNVPLTDISLSDSVYPTDSCTVPPTLEPGAAFECVIGPLPAEVDGHTNTATVTASYLDALVTDSDTASYHIEEDAEQPVIIVVEGPVEAINVNIITIFNLHIEIDPNDPILLTLKVGDYVRVEGTPTAEGDTIVIVAVNITIINIIIIDTDNGGEDNDDGGPIGPVINPPPHSGFSKDACKGGGWQSLRRADGSGFKNQGDCIQYANTGK